MMTQKEIFLESEADAWLSRNYATLQARDFTRDPVVMALASLPELSEKNPEKHIRILEIGCGSGHRLAHLQKYFPVDVEGIEPSQKAVDLSRSAGVSITRGTADSLPYQNSDFDIVIFGFCLYLCDRSDLFTIASEADRVLRDKGWLVIHDFYSPFPIQREYHHKGGIQSYKMDYRKLFDWHPAYTCTNHSILAHGKDIYTDDCNDWVATSVLRKQST